LSKSRTGQARPREQMLPGALSYLGAAAQVFGSRG